MNQKKNHEKTFKFCINCCQFDISFQPFYCRKPLQWLVAFILETAELRVDCKWINQFVLHCRVRVVVVCGVALLNAVQGQIFRSITFHLETFLIGRLAAQRKVMSSSKNLYALTICFCDLFSQSNHLIFAKVNGTSFLWKRTVDCQEKIRSILKPLNFALHFLKVYRENQ